MKKTTCILCALAILGLAAWAWGWSGTTVLGGGQGAEAGTSNCGGAGSGQGFLSTGSENDVPSNRVFGPVITATATCTANKIRIYARTGATTNVYLAVYSDAGTASVEDTSDTLIAYAGPISLSGSMAYASGTLSAPINFVSGNRYWFKFLGDATTYISTTASGTSYYTAQPYGSGVPATLAPAGGPYTESNTIEAYYE
jgi:hypothetical protein